jgi:hypothetical protein
LGALSAGVIIGIVSGLLLVMRGTTTTESATEILQKAGVTQLQAVAALGPNMTYHVVTVQHRDQPVTEMSGFTAPKDSTTDLFMTFDSTGMLSTFWQVSRGADGQIFERGDWIAGTFVFTNTRTGEIGQRVPYGRFPATAIGQRLSQATLNAVAALGAAATVKTATVGTAAAFVIETADNRTYIDKGDYRALKSEQLAPDGHVTEYIMPITVEVLPTLNALQLDMDAATPGVQASLSVSGPQDINIDVVLGDNAGSLGAFNFSLVYDDTRLIPLASSGGLNGNPDFNETALGSTWNCDLAGSSPDIDPVSGPGHGVAFLACFTTGGSTIASATVIATLRLHVAASGVSTITIRDAHFAHSDTTDIGTCDAIVGGSMACSGGAVTAP